MFKKVNYYIKSIFITIMNLVGYERYVKVNSNDAKIVWFRAYKIRPKNFVSFLAKKALRKKHNFSKTDLWSYNAPKNHLLFENGNKYPPTDYAIYLHPKMIQAAIENPVSYAGTNLKIRKVSTEK